MKVVLVVVVVIVVGAAFLSVFCRLVTGGWPWQPWGQGPGA